jgi:hypothetical protein
MLSDVVINPTRYPWGTSLRQCTAIRWRITEKFFQFASGVSRLPLIAIRKSGFDRIHIAVATGKTDKLPWRDSSAWVFPSARR